ncbi:MAG: methyl-accepting chemotaxis protein [Acidobacteriota bacterium]
MIEDKPPRVPSSALGLLLAALLGLVGAAGLTIATGYGAPRWVLDAYVVLGFGALAVYVAFVFFPERKNEGCRAEVKQRFGRLEASLRASFDQLKAGDLASSSQHIEGISEEVAGAFTAAARALAVLIEHIQRSSIEVAAAGGAVHHTADALASGSSQQAAAVVEITASMEELARTAAQIAANAAHQAHQAGLAETSGNAGADAVQEALAGVEEAQKRISAIASRADTLGSRSKEIYRVLDLITEIAQETHILSLNAAIEAAAAGEHGRRFSIVAEEVRRLAQRSRESVESVRNLLEDFAGAIRGTVVATEEGSKEVTRVLARARAAAGAIDELRGALASTARVARETSLATEEQRSASDQVVLTLKEVSQVIQRMAEGLRNFSETADRLNQLALSIQLLTQSFHLDSPRSLKHQAERWAHALSHRAGQWEALSTELGTMMQGSPFVELAYVVDGAGNMQGFATQREGGAREVSASVTIGANFSERPWFQAVMRDHHTILTPLYDSLLTGERCFTVACPVRDAVGVLAGVLGIDVNVRSWTRI